MKWNLREKEELLIIEMVLKINDIERISCEEARKRRKVKVKLENKDKVAFLYQRWLENLWCTVIQRKYNWSFHWHMYIVQYETGYINKQIIK